MNRRLLTGCGILVAVALLHGPCAAAEHFAVGTARPEDSAALRKSNSLRKADTALTRVVAERRIAIKKGTGNTFKPSSAFVRVSADSILIDARAASDGLTLLNDLTRLGLQRGSRYGDVVSGMLPYASIEEALALPSLRSMSASPRPIRNVGAITSQGDSALRADIGRGAFSVDGSGVTVGVISDSYDTLGGAASDIASGDLPAGGVPVLNGESTLCGVLVFCIDEGRAMLQIVYDMAPGADLLFQSGIDGVAAYANAIVNLAASGADVIVDDLLLINEPMFQDGVVAQAIDSVVADGVAYFAAAGNSGRLSYEAPFDDSGEVFCIEFFDPIGDCDPIYERVGRMHDFDPGPGVDNYLNITVPVNGVMTVAMQWDQPFGGPGPTADHDLVLLDGTGQTYITMSANDNIVTGEGWEALQFDNNEVLDYGSDFSLMITYDDVDSIGPPATLVKLVIFGENITINEHATNSGALYGHPNSTSVAAVGAAFFMDTPENGVSPPLLEPFSSAGGTPILFDADGMLLATPEIRQAPDIVAVDGVNTTFFFDDRIGNDGIDDFVGTSAAAPHAAGIAALVLEAKPGAQPDQVYRALQNTAIDMGPAGVDFDSGYGLIQADAAIAAVLASYQNDMNGNGQADILWRNAANGKNWLYLMNGSEISDSQSINTESDPNWQIVGNGDYNGDTYADILWRNTATGKNWMYLMNGPVISSSQLVNTEGDQNWQIVGNGDYNGDGKADILWRNGQTGKNWMYLMDGSAISSSQLVNTESDPNWQVVGNGDYNGDGKADILWRHAISGKNWVYLMDGPVIMTSALINVEGKSFWKIVGSGDYNGDGKSDILWRQTQPGGDASGTVWVYFMDGNSIADSQMIAREPDLDWKIVGSGDYDGDGKSDILWRHQVTGENWIYLMDGSTVTDSRQINFESDQNWQVVNTD